MAMRLDDDGLVRFNFPEPWGGCFVGFVVDNHRWARARLVGEVTELRKLPNRGDVIRVPAIDGDVTVFKAELDVGGKVAQRSCHVESVGPFTVGGVRFSDNGARRA